MYFDNHKYNIITVWYIISQLTEDQSKFGMITQFDSSIKGYSIFGRVILGGHPAHTRKKVWQLYQVEEIWWRKIKHLKRLVYKVSSRFKINDLLTLFHHFNYQLLTFPLVKQFFCIISGKPLIRQYIIVSTNSFIFLKSLHFSFHLLICEYLKNLHIFLSSALKLCLSNLTT